MRTSCLDLRFGGTLQAQSQRANTQRRQATTDNDDDDDEGDGNKNIHMPAPRERVHAARRRNDRNIANTKVLETARPAFMWRTSMHVLGIVRGFLSFSVSLSLSLSRFCNIPVRTSTYILRKKKNIKNTTQTCMYKRYSTAEKQRRGGSKVYLHILKVYICV